VKVIEAYLKAVKLYRDYSDPSQDPEYSEVVTNSQLNNDHFSVEILRAEC